MDTEAAFASRFKVLVLSNQGQQRTPMPPIEANRPEPANLTLTQGHAGPFDKFAFEVLLGSCALMWALAVFKLIGLAISRN
jgi:hypothetical protein